MTKYQPLADFLAAREQPYWRATFTELEAILGFSLPKTARSSGAWWANAPNKPHQVAWLDAGWRVESVDQAGEAVLFHRQGYEPAESSEAPAQPSGEAGGLQRMAGLGAVVGGAVAVAAGLGALAFKLLRGRRS